MGNVPPAEQEVGSAALRRLKLIQIARGPGVSPLRRLLGERVRVILLVVGALLLWDHGITSGLWLALGVVLVVAGLTAPRDRSTERLDALVAFLESTRQLDPNLGHSVDRSD